MMEHRSNSGDSLIYDWSNIRVLCPGPPGPPGGLLVKNVAETSVELRWSRGYDNHSPIGKYIIMGRSSLSSEWKRMRTGVCVCVSVCVCVCVCRTETMLSIDDDNVYNFAEFKY